MEVSLNKDENVSTVVSSLLGKDKKFIKRSVRNITDEIEDLEDELSKRLSANVEIDSSTVEVTYAQILSKKELLDTYKKFESEYLND